MKLRHPWGGKSADRRAAIRKKTSQMSCTHLHDFWGFAGVTNTLLSAQGLLDRSTISIYDSGIQLQFVRKRKGINEI
jgi:hypothetical protein